MRNIIPESLVLSKFSLADYSVACMFAQAVKDPCFYTISMKDKLLQFLQIVHTRTLMLTIARACSRSHADILGFSRISLSILWSALSVNLLRQPDLDMLEVVLNVRQLQTIFQQ
ncbi:hypothetical protein ILYODFUR_033874 [Ilyodon furcidens]|uniref:Uncharacterized protein n=1 Tax=Ilyodon furcidens TaxID=33524 RepID=A0ABV0V930_9TELE